MDNDALWTSIYYGGITLGRFLSGIVSERVKGESFIRGGLVMIASGVLMSIIGLSMAFAYMGSTLLPPLLGAVSGVLTLMIFPYALLVFTIGMVIVKIVAELNINIALKRHVTTDIFIDIYVILR